MVSRREFLKISGASAGALAALRYGFLGRAFGATQGPGLSDPALQPKFASAVPNALDPGFIFDTGDGAIRVGVGQAVQYTGLVKDGAPMPTTIWAINR